jgi:DNA-binding LacI/PurR family transcriptional regulator
VAENPDIACLFLDVSPEADVCCVRFDHRAAAAPAAAGARPLHRLGVGNAVTVFGDWSAASGWHKTFELLHLHPRISAIVVANDQMALGVLSALAQLNRTGSQAISVTGYDDTADSLYFQPPLTTVAQDFNVLGNGRWSC